MKWGKSKQEHTLQDLKIMVHHSLQDIKIIVAKEAKHVISFEADVNKIRLTWGNNLL